MPGRTTIYDPPKEGLPYLVVTFTPDGLKIATAKLQPLGANDRLGRSAQTEEWAAKRAIEGDRIERRLVLRSTQ